MLHKWKTTSALSRHFDFRIHGGRRGEPARLLRRMYTDTPDYRQYSPVMAAAKYLIAYGVRFQDDSLGSRLDRVFPSLLAQGHLNPYQVEVLLSYGDQLTSELAAPRG